jgi:hypothetical protein
VRPARALVALARACGLPTKVGHSATAAELSSGSVVAVFPRLERPGLHVLTLTTIENPAELEAGGGFDAASLLAGIIADRVVWPLHQLVDDGPPHLVVEPEPAEPVS